MTHGFVSVYVTGSDQPVATILADEETAGAILRLVAMGTGMITLADRESGYDYFVAARAVTHVRVLDK